MQQKAPSPAREQTQKPVFSFAIVSYNNYRYIFEAVDSVLQQTYPAIELLVANDGSSDFNQEELSAYIDAHKRENLVRVDIHNNETNLGTVKNIESVRQRATGTYIMYMAADDALYDETVLQRYADEFERLGEDAMVVSSRTAMCGSELSQLMDYLPDEYGVKLIRDGTPSELFSHMSHTFTIPTTSTCYRTELYNAIGQYDTEYFIIEDASFFMRLSRLGIKVHWIDDMVGARHRDGGISHSRPKKITETYRRYRYDEILLFEKEILPYQDRLLPEDRKKTMEKWEYVRRAYELTFPKTKWHKLKYRLEPKLSKICEKMRNTCRNMATPGTPQFTLLAAWGLCFFVYLVISGMSFMGLGSSMVKMCGDIVFVAGAILISLWLLQVFIFEFLYYAGRTANFFLKVAVKLADKHLAKHEV